MFRSIIGGLLIGLSLGAPAHANAQSVEACRAMSLTIAPRQAEIEELRAVRDAAATHAEAQGDLWEEAEVHRLISPRHGEAADAARASFDAARKVLARHEMSLQAIVRAFNDDTERYNQLCAAEK